MIHLVQAAKRQKTPNEIALQILISGPHFNFFNCLFNP
jgi:high-affinity K+ transport system ATPase subunit B